MRVYRYGNSRRSLKNNKENKKMSLLKKVVISTLGSSYLLAADATNTATTSTIKSSLFLEKSVTICGNCDNWFS